MKTEAQIKSRIKELKQKREKLVYSQWYGENSKKISDEIEILKTVLKSKNFE